MRTPFAVQSWVPDEIDAYAEEGLRARVVARAMDWIGTPYRQWGNTLHHAVDCAMLLAEVYRDAGLIAPVDPRPYPPEWHLHRSDERYLAWLQPVSIETATPQAGDIALFQFGRCFSHAGIMINADELVHAYAPLGVCTVSRLTDSDIGLIAPGRARPRRFFDIFAPHREGTA
jgi:cell wall-associated NlpC family hydrolase